MQPGGQTVAMREFDDERGEAWQVVDVQPSYVERRSGGDRRSRARGPDRRRGRQHRMVVAPRFRFGWLVFESRRERRRLGPIPPSWEYATEEELRRLLGEAEQLRSVG